MQYNLIQLDSFQKSLKTFPPADTKKLIEKATTMLSQAPYRYNMLIGTIEINGIKFTGLRKFKSGSTARKGGVYILYRICEECKKNEYYKINKKICDFCEDEMDKHVVLFISRPRSFGY